MIMKSKSSLTVSKDRDKGIYMPGLDGLRALSVLVVIVYHLNSSWIPGGLLGVSIFFTLSGYLITDQLIMQWQTTRRINMKDFWMKRVRRLMPAMIFMLIIVGLWLLIFDRAQWIHLQGDFVSVLLYFNNWWLIFHNVSYFESFGPPSPIGHLWSLAIEEQFYFLWPLVLALVLRVVTRRGKLFLFTLAGALASILAMVFIYQPGIDPSRVYYGTDTRAFALLIGGALAIVWPSRRLSERSAGKSNWILDLLGGASLIGILLMMWITNAYDAFLYVGGLAFFSVLSAIVIAALAHPASILAKVLGCKPFRWIGKRSYSLYIWHYPVIILTSTTIDTGETHISKIAIQVVLSLLLAAFSYSCIEEPFRRGVVQLRSRKIGFWSPLRFRTMLVVTILPIQLFVISCSNHLSAENPHESPLATTDAVTTVNTASPTPSVTITVTETPAPTATPSPRIEETPSPILPDQELKASQMPSSEGEAEIKEAEPLTDPEVEKDKSITAIGDSVILDAAPFLGELLPGIIVDGKVGRQMSQAQTTIDDLKSKGMLGKRVIIELGTNGAFNPNYLRELLTSLGDVQQIILVNTRVPRSWQDSVNTTLEKVAAEFPKVTIVDWYSASKGKESFFVEDRVHLTEEGARYYASLINDAIRKDGW